MTEDNSTPTERDKPARRATRVAFVFWFLVAVVPLVGVLLSLFYPVSFYETQEEYRAFAERLPTSGPLFFILLQIGQVVIAPISHVTVSYMGGFLYGPYYGAILNWFGRVVGHSIAFGIARHLGRRVVNRFVSPATIAKYDKYVSGQYAFLFIAYFLPLFPDDELSYLCGLSRMRFRPFLLINLVGQIGGSFALAQLGSGIDTRDPLFWIVLVATVLAFIALWPILRRMKATEDTK